MVLLLVFMQLTRDLFAIAKFLLFLRHSENGMFWCTAFIYRSICAGNRMDNIIWQNYILYVFAVLVIGVYRTSWVLLFETLGAIISTPISRALSPDRNRTSALRHVYSVTSSFMWRRRWSRSLTWLAWLDIVVKSADVIHGRPPAAASTRPSAWLQSTVTLLWARLIRNMSRHDVFNSNICSHQSLHV